MPRLLKPKVLHDIAPRHSRRGFSGLHQRINLSYRRVVTVSLGASVKLFVGVMALRVLSTGSVAAPTVQTLSAAEQVNEKERRELEVQLRELEQQIDQYEGQVSTYRKQGNNLKDEIVRLNSKISKLNLQIKAINLTLTELDRKIGDTEDQIGSTEQEIAQNRAALASLLRNIYHSDQASLIEIFLQKPRLSDFFTDLNSIASLQSNLRVALGEFVSLNGQLTELKDELSLERADAATIKEYQARQKTEADRAKQNKNELLIATKGEESRYQDLLEKTKQTAAEIRNRLFKLLGGGELTFEEAYEYARLASNATGIRPALLLAVLDRESALGQNVGRCGYKTAMHPTRDIPIFLEITKELGINPDSVTVSCANADGVYGGAMGPAQFIPSTWELYRKRVERVTGNSPASPWNNEDAFVATGLYISDSYNSNSCGEYAAQIPNQEQLLRERCAAAKYYAGSRWYYYRWAYGEPVIQRAARFEEDIRAITS